MKKSFKSYKKILLGVLIFICSCFLMNENVFAAESSIKNSPCSTRTKETCNSSIGTGGNLCMWRTESTFFGLGSKSVCKEESAYPAYVSDCSVSGSSEFLCNRRYNKTTGKKCKFDSATKKCINSSTTPPKNDSSSSGNANSGSSSSGSSSNSTDKYNISFNVNGGYSSDFPCPDKTSVTSPGVCYGYVPSGTVVNYPSKSNELTKEGYGSILGWVKSSDSSSIPTCTTSNITPTKSSVTVNSHTALYACYEDIINGLRYAQDGASYDGQNVECGKSLGITKCYVSNGLRLCNYDMYDNSSRNGVVYRDKISNEDSSSYCSGVKSETPATESSECNKYDADIPGDRYAAWNSYATGDIVKLGDKLHITSCNCESPSTCTFDAVNDKSASGTVYRANLSTTFEDRNPESDSCTTEKIKDLSSTTVVNVCNGKSYENLVSCSSGYSFDKTSSYFMRKCTGSDDCEQYNVVCEKNGGVKPKINAPAVNVQSDGYGYINVNATSSTGASITGIHVDTNYVIPTASSSWDDFKNSARIKGSPGTYYVWVKDSLGNISDTYRTAVVDTVNTDTTLDSLKLYDENGDVQTPNPVAYETNDVSSNDYVRLSNKIKTSMLANAAFNPFTTEYKVTVDSPTMTVYATLTSSDSKYIDGYEPRTVNLTYGINTILIKIQDNTGKIRTYTIIVTRTDDRKADNTLSKIKVDKGKLDFNSNITDYKVTIPTSTTNVNVESTIGSDLASYVGGYEPGNVEIKNDVTVKLIKVKSQTGSTRTYVITFVKEGSDVIKDKSLMLHSLAIPGVYVPFEKEILNYSFSVGYQNEIINLYPSLEDDISTYVISLKKNSDTEYKTVSSYGIKLDVGENYLEIKVINNNGEESIYRFTIIRKEFGLEISNDTSLKDLTVLGHDIKFKPNKKDYTIKIKTEKTLVITAVPNSNRAEVFIRGNEELTGFSTVRVKVVAENGKFETYSIDIKKDVFNKTIEMASIIVGGVIIIGTCCILIIKKQRKQHKEYVEE